MITRMVSLTDRQSHAIDLALAEGRATSLDEYFQQLLALEERVLSLSEELQSLIDDEGDSVLTQRHKRLLLELLKDPR